MDLRLQLRKDEEIKEIEGYEGYYITSHGRVYSEKSDKWLEGSCSEKTNWYVTVGLTKNGKSKNFRVHRLVYKAFGDFVNLESPFSLCRYNPEDFDELEVHHIDECKDNNHIDNLLICDAVNHWYMHHPRASITPEKMYFDDDGNCYMGWDDYATYHLGL